MSGFVHHIILQFLRDLGFPAFVVDFVFEYLPLDASDPAGTNWIAVDPELFGSPSTEAEPSLIASLRWGQMF